jgi:hypothetical protein
MMHLQLEGIGPIEGTRGPDHIGGMIIQFLGNLTSIVKWKGL